MKKTEVAILLLKTAAEFVDLTSVGFYERLVERLIELFESPETERTSNGSFVECVCGAQHWHSTPVRDSDIFNCPQCLKTNYVHITTDAKAVLMDDIHSYGAEFPRSYFGCATCGTHMYLPLGYFGDKLRSQCESCGAVNVVHIDPANPTRRKHNEAEDYHKEVWDNGPHYIHCPDCDNRFSIGDQIIEDCITSFECPACKNEFEIRFALIGGPTFNSGNADEYDEFHDEEAAALVRTVRFTFGRKLQDAFNTRITPRATPSQAMRELERVLYDFHSGSPPTDPFTDD